MRGAFAILTITALAFNSASVASTEKRGTAEEQTDCMTDVFRLCSAQIPDEAAILACLQSKAPHLSPACHRVIEPGYQTRG